MNDAISPPTAAMFRRQVMSTIRPVRVTRLSLVMALLIDDANREIGGSGFQESSVAMALGPLAAAARTNADPLSAAMFLSAWAVESGLPLLTISASNDDGGWMAQLRAATISLLDLGAASSVGSVLQLHTVLPKHVSYLDRRALSHELVMAICTRVALARRAVSDGSVEVSIRSTLALLQRAVEGMRAPTERDLDWSDIS